jgi:hydroxymethylbilane synthase
VRFVLATRGSPLALWQAERTRDLLRARDAAQDVELVVIDSHGDRDRAQEIARLGEVGVFTVAIDAAVLDGRADAGVHSLKDMTTTLQDGLLLSGTLVRGPVEDALVTNDGRTLADLPAGARVATGSIRRAAMLRHARGDLAVVGVRGNVDTRLAKLDAGEAEALVLARAGLERLGLGERIAEVLDAGRFVPAAGQGIVGLTARVGDVATHERLVAITDQPAWHAAVAERTLLRALRGGCNAPIGVYARQDGAVLSVHAIVLAPDGSETLEERGTGAPQDAQELAQELARRLLERGAGALIEQARAVP